MQCYFIQLIQTVYNLFTGDEVGRLFFKILLLYSLSTSFIITCTVREVMCKSLSFRQSGLNPEFHIILLHSNFLMASWHYKSQNGWSSKLFLFWTKFNINIDTSQLYRVYWFDLEIVYISYNPSRSWINTLDFVIISQPHT